MKRILLPLLLAGCLMLSSCNVLESIANQLIGVANLANCEYSLKDVTNVSVAGVNLKKVSNGNISATDIVKLTAALAAKKVPLSMNVNIDVTNPTEQQAALTAMDWLMEVDNAQLATGTSTQNYTISAGKTTAVPLAVNTDVYSLFSSGGIESLKNFVKSFSSDGTSSSVKLKIKPSVMVGTVPISSPNYITLEKKTGTAATNNTTSTTNTNTTGKTGSGKPVQGGRSVGK